MSGNLPWFPFWVRDFLTSRTVAAMSMEEVGVYIMLLCQQWEDGPIPNDPDSIARIIRADPNVVRTTLERCFNVVQDRWQNDRLEKVREEQQEKAEKYSRAGRASGRARRNNKARNDLERRSNDVRTSLEHPSNNTDTDTDKRKETDSSKSLPISDLWGVWLEELGAGKGKPPKLTTQRRLKLKALYLEHLEDEDDPLAFFRRILKTVQRSDHHMSKRAYQMPESLFVSEDRRDKWVQETLNPSKPKPGTEAHKVAQRGEPRAPVLQVYRDPEDHGIQPVDVGSLLRQAGIERPNGAA